MNTLFFGQHIINLDETGSTNNYTSEFLRHNVMQEGTIVVAKNQISGKGQRGNVWISNANENLTFSVFIKPNFIPVIEQFILNKWVSLSIISVLKEIGLNTKVKWPNDIYVNDKKVAGILIENSVGSKINHSIIGIGLNVNQKEFLNLPEASSMSNCAGKDFDLDSILEKICSFLEQNYLRIKADKLALNDEYLTDLYQYNEWSNYRDKHGEFSGKIVGISEIGMLEIAVGNELRKYAFKEVEFIT